VQALIQPFPDDNASRAFDPAVVTAILWESGGGTQRHTAEITREEASGKKLFGKTSPWRVLTEFATNVAPRYEKYSYSRRADLFRLTIPLDQAPALLHAMLESAPGALRHRWSTLRPPAALTFVCPR